MKAFLFVVALIVANIAQADSKMTKIEGENLRCERHGGMIAIKTYPQGQEKVWQGDPGDATGIEFDDVNIKFARCMNCFDITAKATIFDQTIDYNILVDGGPMGKVITMKMILKQGNQEQTISGFNCQAVRQQ